MRTRIFTTLIIMLLSFRAFGQIQETYYPATLAATGFLNNIPLASDGPFPVGFTFNFYGNNYTNFYICANGLITFDDPSSFYSTEVTIPTAAAPNNYIAAFWDDLTIETTGKILYTTIGTAPTRKCIIQFKNMSFYNPPRVFGTFQIILYEGSNNIQIQYRLIVDPTNPKAHGESATIGIENASGTDGVLHAFHNSAAISNNQAISFTPSGPSYTTNSNAIYYPVYLQQNMSQPDPGIPSLISPPQDAVVDTFPVFKWTSASDASSYILKLSLDSSLGTVTTYLPGSDTTYSITGLFADTTYYWVVFSVNASGETWCEKRRFRTSNNPPLFGIPQTVWVEQGMDRTIQLDFTGGDASQKTGVITSFPADGQLYQYNAGTRGPLISLVPATVTDASFRVIYAATGATGNGAGNFSFRFSDVNGSSPDALLTVNVSPPGVPNVLNVSRDQNVEVEFDRRMNDPSGKQAQFTVIVNGSPVLINSATLKTGDPYTIRLILAIPLGLSETVSVSYTKGSVSAQSGALLESFSSLPVTLKSQTINFSSLPVKRWLDPPFSPSPPITTNSGLSVILQSSNTSVATASGLVMTITGVGLTNITAFQAGDANFAPARFIQQLTVDKALQSITFAALPLKTYGDADFSPGATSSSGLTVSYASDNPAVATIVSGKIHITGAGSAVITASQAGDSKFQAATPVNQSLTVQKANQTITFNALSDRTYGDADFAPGATSSSGLTVSYASDNSSVATIVSGMIHIVGAGDVNITASQAGDNNYNPATPVVQPLHVKKADQVITFNALTSRNYGDADFALSASSSSGLSVSFSSSNTSVATIAGNVLHIAGAGSSTITASQPGDNNYNPAPDVQQVQVVNKVNITFTADNKTKIYLDPLPALTYTITGFVLGETQSVLDVLPSIVTTAVQSSPTGTFPITISGGSDNNYNYIYVSGTLTITSLPQTITFTRVPEKLLVGDTSLLKAVSSAGLTVLFESLDENIASVSAGIITGVSKGTAQIRAYNNGDVNIGAAEIITSVEVSSTHRDIMNLFTPNGDGFNDYWELPQMTEWGKCEVKVYNRWGKLVYDNADYNNLWDGTSNGKPLPEGAYYFVIKTENAGTVKGTVNIVR